MRHQDGHEPRTGANADAQRALYALLAGAAGRETSAGSARMANDDEAIAVGREEREAPKEKVAENLSLEAQG